MTQSPTRESISVAVPLRPPTTSMRAARGRARLITIGTKIVRLIVVLYIVVTASFFMLQLVPGDPAAAAIGPGASQAEYAQARHSLGLDQALGHRYLTYLSHVLHGNLGQSLFPPRQSVASLLAQRAPVTIEIAILALLVALIVAVPAAMWAAARKNALIDKALTGTSFGLISIPSFLAGLLLVYVCVFHVNVAKTVVALALVWGALAVARSLVAQLRHRRRGGGDGPAWRDRGLLGTVVGFVVLLGLAALAYTDFPHFSTQGFVKFSVNDIGANLKSATLPVLALALTQMAVFIRVLRNDLIHTLGEDYILAARAKGMPAWRILARDALRPSLFSLITVVSVSLGQLIGGSVIIESLFNIPGLGNLVYTSVTKKDFPVVQGCVIMIATVYILINLAVDIAYSYLDPRIRRGA